MMSNDGSWFDGDIKLPKVIVRNFVTIHNYEKYSDYPTGDIGEPYPVFVNLYQRVS